MRYNDRSVVTAQNIRAKLGFKDAHSVHNVVKRFGIEHWKLTGKELMKFKVDNKLINNGRWLTVYPADAFDGFSGNKPMKTEEESPVKNSRMAQELTALSFENKEFGALRSIVKGGSPWFVGIDVAKALGYTDVWNAIRDHVDDDDKISVKRSKGMAIFQSCQNDKFSASLDTIGFTVPPRGLTVINESGMYSLILSSKLPSAKRFKHWITSEVLPSIRKTGGYGAEGSLATIIDNQRILMRSMQSLWLYLSTRDGLAAGFSREIANKELR